MKQKLDIQLGITLGKYLQKVLRGFINCLMFYFNFANHPLRTSIGTKLVLSAHRLRHLETERKHFWSSRGYQQNPKGILIEYITL